MNPELKRMLATLADTNAELAKERQGIETILAAADGDEPRELNEQELEQIAGAKARIEVLTAKRDNTQARHDNLKAALAAERESQLARSGDRQPEGLQIHGTGPVAETMPDRGFGEDIGMGAFAQAVAQVHTGAVDQRLAPLAAVTGQGMNSGPGGGYLVPPMFSNMIWDGVAQASESLIGRCDVYNIPIGADSMTFNANAETSRATGSRWGGVRSYWIAEGDQLTASTVTFRQVKLEPQQLAVLVYATDKLLSHASTMSQWITRAATDEIAFAVGDSIMEGDGVGKPQGIKTAACTVTVAKESGQAADTIVSKNIGKMWARLHPRSRAGAVWFNNVDTEPTLEDMSVAVGTGGQLVYMPPGGIADAPLARMKGRPVQPLEYCETVGDKGDIVLADLGAYAVGLRETLDSAVSMHLRFDYLESVFRFVFEIDGKPWLSSAITPFKGTATLSPFVNLAARA